MNDCLRTTCIDFGRSFICGNGSTMASGPASSQLLRNDARFQLQSVLRLEGGKQQPPLVYYQCASCKAENTFEANNLFMEDNYDFLPVFGNDEIIAFRRKAALDEMPYKTVSRTVTHPWGRPMARVVEQSATALTTFEQIAAATQACVPLVARTRFRLADAEVDVEIEYPVNTMNIRHVPAAYQVDTGPVLFPNISHSAAFNSDQLSLAFVAFSSSIMAAFIIEEAVPVLVDGKPIRQIMHYSRALEMAAENELWAMGSAPAKKLS